MSNNSDIISDITSITSSAITDITSDNSDNNSIISDGEKDGQIQKQTITINQITNEISRILKLLQGSNLISVIYENGLKVISDKICTTEFFKNKTNIKYFMILLCLLFASTLIGMLSYFLFYITFFFSSLKCILWLFEQYKPDTHINTCNIYNTCNDELKVSYVSETSPIDILEYYVAPIFIVMFMYPIAYVSIPFVSFFLHSASVLIALACMTSKFYRQKFCLLVQGVFTNKESRDEAGNFVPGHEGEFHKFLQKVCYTIECINFSTFNITHNPRSTYHKLNSLDTDTFTQSVRAIINNK